MRTRQWFLVSSITFLFCFAFLSLSLAQEKLPAIVKRIEPSTVVIITYDKEGQILTQGSGFFISKNGDIITNRHVLQGAIHAEVKITKGEIYPITQIVAEDKEGDIIRASVDISQRVVYPLSVSASIPEVGERVLIIGSPLGLEQTVTDGIVSAVRDIPTFGNIIQISASISPGSSGSPVVNMKGEVIGIASFQIIEGQNLNFAIPGERIAKLTPGRKKTLTKWEIDRAKKELASAKALYITGLKFLLAGDYENALSYFEKAVKRDPHYAKAHFQIGYCNGKLGRHSEEIRAYKKTIYINPHYALAHYNLGVTYGELGHYSEAVKFYKQAIRIKPDYADAYYNLGTNYVKLGCYKKAIKTFKQTIRIKPNHAGAYSNMGVAYVRLGRWNEAIKAYEEAIRIKSDAPETYLTYFNLGIAYGQFERYAEAIEAFKQALRIRPNDTETHFTLGLTYLYLGDRSSALDEYTILKELDKKLADSLFNKIYE